MRTEKSCGTIIYNNNKVLVIKQKNSGNYGFPKGHMITNETEIETAIRETKEETNLDVNINKLFRYSISYNQNKNNEVINKEVIYFIAEVKNGNVIKKQDKEISSIAWIDIEKVQDMLTYDNLKNIWAMAYKDIKKL